MPVKGDIGRCGATFREACVGLSGKTRRLLCGELCGELSGEEQAGYAERSVQIATERKVPD